MDERQKQQHFSEEYPELFDYLYRYVCYRIPDRDEAEDVVSEVFMKSYARLAEFRPELGVLRQWLTGIAKNEILMHWRRRRPFLPLESMELTGDVEVGAHLAENLDERMLAEKIFEQLPPSCKALVALRYAEGLSYEELAETTGKNVTALRQFFSRLHRSLRIEFQDLRD